MPQRYNHYEPTHYSDDASAALYDDETGPAYPSGRQAALVRRLEQLEAFTQQMLLTRQAPAEVRPVADTSAPRVSEPERTLWQGRPAVLACLAGLLSAALWGGLWWLGLQHLQGTVAVLRSWRLLLGQWLIQTEAFTTLSWYDQATAWLQTPALAEDLVALGLLLCMLGAAGLLVYRLWRALRIGYCLTTQRLSTRHGGQWVDVALTDLDRVVVRRPWLGGLLGYVHVHFRGHAPVQRQVHWWGVSQRALLTALLQATLPQTEWSQRRRG